MQVGSLDWARATSGRLSGGDRRSFIAPVLRQSFGYGIGRVRLLLGLRRKPGAALDLDSFAPPDSRLTREAEAEARETLSPAMLNHSCRTFLYGLALARLDEVDVDPEHLYVTALLHDIALETPDAGCCFAVRGAFTMHELALRAGASEETARTLAEAIAHHITPGVGHELGPLAPLLQLGAMVDLTGMRLWEVESDFADAVLMQHPRGEMKAHLGVCWRAEAAAFPEGRAAFVERVSRFSLLVRLAPFAS